MAVVTEDGWEYDLWRVRPGSLGSHVLTVSWGGRTRIDGSGLRSAATAAHFGLAAGSIRAAELEAGHIPHALFMVVPCTNGRSTYPALRGATGAACRARRGAPPLGSRFRLSISDREIARLRAPAWKKTILKAMAEYGMFVGDTGGRRGWSVFPESGAAFVSLGQPDPLEAFAQRSGVPRVGGRYVFDIASGVDWGRRLRLVHPCVTARRC